MESINSKLFNPYKRSDDINENQTVNISPTEFANRNNLREVYTTFDERYSSDQTSKVFCPDGRTYTKFKMDGIYVMYSN